jgi:hypothetical protein
MFLNYSKCFERHSSCRQPQTYVKPEVAITVFELLMVSCVSLETRSVIKKYWIINSTTRSRFLVISISFTVIHIFSPFEHKTNIIFMWQSCKIHCKFLFPNVTNCTTITTSYLIRTHSWPFMSLFSLPYVLNVSAVIRSITLLGFAN